MFDRLQTLCRFAGGHGNQEGRKSGPHERIENSLRVKFPRVFVRDNGATLAQLQAGTFMSKIFEEGGADFNRVTPAAKLDGDGSHVHRIGISQQVSKFDQQIYRASGFLPKLAKILSSEQKETGERIVWQAVNNSSKSRKPLSIKVILQVMSRCWTRLALPLLKGGHRRPNRLNWSGGALITNQ